MLLSVEVPLADSGVVLTRVSGRRVRAHHQAVPGAQVEAPSEAEALARLREALEGHVLVVAARALQAGPF